MQPDPYLWREAIGTRGHSHHGTMVWKIQTDSIVLAQGVELHFGETFARKLDRYGLRRGKVGRQVNPTLYVDPRSGELLDVGFAGCA